MITNIKIIQWYIKLLGGFLSSAKLKRRYFRLDDDFLLHYYKEDNGSAQGNIDLSTAFKVELTNEPDKALSQAILTLRYIHQVANGCFLDRWIF